MKIKFDSTEKTFDIIGNVNEMMLYFEGKPIGYMLSAVLECHNTDDLINCVFDDLTSLTIISDDEAETKITGYVRTNKVKFTHTGKKIIAEVELRKDIVLVNQEAVDDDNS